MTGKKKTKEKKEKREKNGVFSGHYVINRFEKIGLKNGPLWAEIIEKKQNGVPVWFGMPCLKVFLQVSRPMVVRFSNQFLH